MSCLEARVQVKGPCTVEDVRGAPSKRGKRSQGGVTQKSTGLTTTQNWEEADLSNHPTLGVEKIPKRPSPMSQVIAAARQDITQKLPPEELWQC